MTPAAFGQLLQYAQVPPAGTLPAAASNASATTTASLLQASALPSTNLVAYYPFDSSANDVTGKYNLTATGNPTYVPGKFGNAVYFNNNANAYATQYLFNTSLGSTVLTGGPITVSFWFNLASNVTGSYQPTMFTLAGGSFSANINPNNQLIIGYATKNMPNVQFFNRNNVTPSKPYHLVMMYDGTTVTAYLNNVSIGSSTQAGAWKYSGGLRIGDMGTVTGNKTGFNGWIDDFRVYNRALTVTEINALFTATSVSATTTTPVTSPTP